jgi:hypothetical protein
MNYNKQFKVDDNTIWEDTGEIKVHNYPPDSRMTMSYVTRIYKQYIKGEMGFTYVEGKAIYCHTVGRSSWALVKIMGEAQNELSKTLPREEFLTEINK